MTDPTPTTTPADDPTAAELAALRKEKTDRDAADKKRHDDELAELRQYKTDQETAAAKRVKAPTPKADKVEPAVTDKPTKKRGGVSRSWFGDQG